MANQPGAYITFNQRSPSKNGWIRLEAVDLEAAKQWAETNYPGEYSMVYSAELFSPEYFPSGELGFVECQNAGKTTMPN